MIHDDMKLFIRLFFKIGRDLKSGEFVLLRNLTMYVTSPRITEQR